jgi:PAS domain S-box-containing protein
MDTNYRSPGEGEIIMKKSGSEMVVQGGVTGAVGQITVNFRVLVYIIALTAIIFYVDAITPLGLTVWILYFIPLILTLYLSWRYAPFFAAGIFLILLGITFFLSPRDTSLLFALVNRVFFLLVLLITAVFIWNHKKSEEIFQKNEERFRCLAESSSDAMVVHIDGKVVYVNRSALVFFGADSREDLVGKDLALLVDPSDLDMVRKIIEDAIQGTPTPVRIVRMIGPGGSGIQVEMLDEKVMWDRTPAVMTIIRDISDLNRSGD